MKVAKTIIARKPLCVVGSSHRACSCGRATSITDHVKTLSVVSFGDGTQDVVLGLHKRVRGRSSTAFRTHNYVTENGRFYDAR